MIKFKLINDKLSLGRDCNIKMYEKSIIYHLRADVDAANAKFLDLKFILKYMSIGLIHEKYIFTHRQGRSEESQYLDTY